MKTGASRHVVGAVLEQGGRDPVAFETRKLTRREGLTPAYDSELFGIVRALNKWGTMLEAKKLRNRSRHAEASS